jgi:hypothetical protein
MNLMLASSGYPWTVIRVGDREAENQVRRKIVTHTLTLNLAQFVTTTKPSGGFSVQHLGGCRSWALCGYHLI